MQFYQCNLVNINLQMSRIDTQRVIEYPYFSYARPSEGIYAWQM